MTARSTNNETFEVMELNDAQLAYCLAQSGKPAGAGYTAAAEWANPINPGVYGVSKASLAKLKALT